MGKILISGEYISAVLLMLLFTSGVLRASGNQITDAPPIDYRTEMRSFVQKISSYARSQNPRFLIIPQNGEELLTADGMPTGAIISEYVHAIDGIGREDLMFGYEGDDRATPAEEEAYMQSFLSVARENGLSVFVTDYCSTPAFVDKSYAGNAARGYISFAADSRALDTVPQYPEQPYKVHPDGVRALNNAQNFLYIINPQRFESRQQFIATIQRTDFDVIFIDLFFNDGMPLTAEEVALLKRKHNGGERIVVCYMSIGEAETYRYYWRPEWIDNPPVWLDEENPHWEGNYKVRYWQPEWQKVIVGDATSYLQKILDAQFDGVYLDIIDAFWYYENKNQP